MRREYVVPLRRGFRNTEKHQKAKKAGTVLKEFLLKHMKGEEVKIGINLNEHLWSRGIRNPPHKVSIICEKDEEGVVFAELPGHQLPSEIKAEEEKQAKREEQQKKAKEKREAEEKKAKEVKTEAKPAQKEAKPTEKKAEAPKKEEKKDASEKKE